MGIKWLRGLNAEQKKKENTANNKLEGGNKTKKTSALCSTLLGGYLLFDLFDGRVVDDTIRPLRVDVFRHVFPYLG